mmetsp:Transcript_30471/g.64547  ORF Transcript_30471/g.64547 Transcript_30471/m.64547 type:complete len:239 (+) Transcript_30471:157-873(+)
MRISGVFFLALVVTTSERRRRTSGLPRRMAPSNLAAFQACAPRDDVPGFGNKMTTLSDVTVEGLLTAAVSSSEIVDEGGRRSGAFLELPGVSKNTLSFHWCPFGDLRGVTGTPAVLLRPEALRLRRDPLRLELTRSRRCHRLPAEPYRCPAPLGLRSAPWRLPRDTASCRQYPRLGLGSAFRCGRKLDTSMPSSGDGLVWGRRGLPRRRRGLDRRGLDGRTCRCGGCRRARGAGGTWW